MLLYPFCVLFVGAIGVYSVARRTKNSATTLIIALLFLLSALTVLVAFLRFTQTASIALGRGLFLFEVSRQSVLGCVVALLLISSSALFYIPGLREGELAQKSAALLLAGFCAIGSALSVDSLSFAVLLGGVAVLALVLTGLSGKVSLNPYLHLLYFTPCVMLLLFAVLAPNLYSSSGSGPVSGAAVTLLVLTLAAYLLFWPFGIAMVRLLFLDTAGAPLPISLVSTSALIGLVKFLPHIGSLDRIVGVPALASALAWAVAGYRSKDVVSTVRKGYLAQTSAVTAMITGALMNEALPRGDWFLLLANHVVSGLGLLLCVWVRKEGQGRSLRGFFVFFLFCFLGLPPSPGFFARLHVFSASIGGDDLFAYLLKISLVVNLFLVFRLPKSLSLFSRPTAGNRWPPLSILWALGLLASCLILSMLFLPYLCAYLAVSGL